MTKIYDKISILKGKLAQHKEELKNLSQTITNLKSDHLQGIREKNQQLKNLEVKLIDFQQTKDNLQKELDEKVKEIENANISNSEKQTRINKILTDNVEEFNSLCKETLTIWGNYEKSRDRIVELWEKRQLAEQETIQELKKTIDYLKRKSTRWKVISFTLVIWFFLILIYSLKKTVKKLKKYETNSDQ